MIKTRDIRGLPTGWVESGDAGKPILLLLHGYPDTPEVWDRQAKYFSERFQVIRPYSRGVGPSKPAKQLARYGRDGAVFDILQILGTVDPGGKRPVILAGHDLGAVQAAALAPYLGTRLKAVIFFNGISLRQMTRRLLNPLQLLKSWYIYPILIPGFAESLARRFARRILRSGRIGAAIDGDRESLESRVVLPLRQYRALATELPAAAVEKPPRLHCPVLVLWGVRDTALVSPNRDEWDGVGTDVTIRLLKGGHWILREKSAVVNGLLDDFLREKGVIHDAD